jgi:hypothetical protein
MVDHCAGGAASGPGDSAGAGSAASDAEVRLEQLAPGYLAKVRSAVSALAVGAGGSSGGLSVELAALREASDFDLDVPTASTSPAGSYLKAGVKRATGWYLRYLTAQLGTFAAAVTATADAAASRLERLEATDAEVVAQLDRLCRRVERLEAAAAATTADIPRVSPGAPGGRVPPGASEPGGAGSERASR